MKTFQIEEKTERAGEELVQPHGRKRERKRKQEVHAREGHAEERVGGDMHRTVTEGAAEQKKYVVERAARNAAGGAEEENMQLLHHLKSALNARLPAP